MSDQWKIYPCQMGPDRAWISFDFGISKTINTEAPPQLLKIRIAFKPRPDDGLPDNQEFPWLAAVDQDIESLAQKYGALYVGRITVAGHRHCYLYTPEDNSAWHTRLETLSQRHRCAVASYSEPDEKRDGYWKELYPDDNSWQVIQDMEVLEILGKQGDDGSTPRRIEHWAYFPAKSDSDQFAKWLGENGYPINQLRESQDGQFGVKFCHDGTLGLVDITTHTIHLKRMAKEFRGTYDGWETPVCKPESVTASNHERHQNPGKGVVADGPKESWVQRLLKKWRAG